MIWKKFDKLSIAWQTKPQLIQYLNQSNILDRLSKEWKVDMANNNTSINLNTKAVFILIKNMGMENYFINPILSIKVNGETVNFMAKVFFILLMIKKSPEFKEILKTETFKDTPLFSY